ncbi:MAG: hypothetical protein AAGA80_21965 [Cyanobacteria bacterium P01_F01_bin.143]
MSETITQESTEDQVGFFQDKNQESSSVRLMGFLSLTGAIIFGLLTVLHAGSHGGQTDSSNGLYITFALLTAAFVPKATQKFAENKIKK